MVAWQSGPTTVAVPSWRWRLWNIETNSTVREGMATYLTRDDAMEAGAKALHQRTVSYREVGLRPLHYYVYRGPNGRFCWRITGNHMRNGNRRVVALSNESFPTIDSAHAAVLGHLRQLQIARSTAAVAAAGGNTNQATPVQRVSTGMRLPNQGSSNKVAYSSAALFAQQRDMTTHDRSVQRILEALYSSACTILQNTSGFGYLFDEGKPLFKLGELRFTINFGALASSEEKRYSVKLYDPCRLDFDLYERVTPELVVVWETSCDGRRWLTTEGTTAQFTSTEVTDESGQRTIDLSGLRPAGERD